MEKGYELFVKGKKESRLHYMPNRLSIK